MLVFFIAVFAYLFSFLHCRNQLDIPTVVVLTSNHFQQNSRYPSKKDHKMIIVLHVNQFCIFFCAFMCKLKKRRGAETKCNNLLDE